MDANIAYVKQLFGGKPKQKEFSKLLGWVKEQAFEDVHHCARWATISIMEDALGAEERPKEGPGGELPSEKLGTPVAELELLVFTAFGVYTAKNWFEHACDALLEAKIYFGNKKSLSPEPTPGSSPGGRAFQTGVVGSNPAVVGSNPAVVDVKSLAAAVAQLLAPQFRQFQAAAAPTKTEEKDDKKKKAQKKKEKDKKDKRKDEDDSSNPPSSEDSEKDEAEDEDRSSGDESADEISEEEKGANSADLLKAKHLLSPKVGWKKLAGEHGVPAFITALRSYYTSALAGRQKETDYIFEIAAFAAEGLVATSCERAKSLFEDTAARCLTRLEFFRSQKSLGAEAAAALEAELLDDDVPPNIRKARRAAEKRAKETKRAPETTRRNNTPKKQKQNNKKGNNNNNKGNNRAQPTSGN